MLISWFTSHQYDIQAIAIYALLAFSVQVSMRSGAFSLASIGFYGVGSYSAAYLAKHGHSTIYAVAAGILISAVAGWILARLLVRLRDLYLAMATVAFDLVVGIIAINWTSVTGGPAGLYSIPVRVSMWAMVVTVAVVAAILTLLEAGVLGRTFVAIREDEQLAQSLSIDANRQRRFAFVLSAMIGSLAGSYHSLSSFAITPEDISFNLIILILAMVIIGGFTSWVGALFGAILLTWVPLELSGLGRWWPVVYGAGLLLIAVYVPRGIFGVVHSLVQRLTVRAPRPHDEGPNDARAKDEPMSTVPEQVTT